MGGGRRAVYTAARPSAPTYCSALHTYKIDAAICETQATIETRAHLGTRCNLLQHDGIPCNSGPNRGRPGTAMASFGCSWQAKAGRPEGPDQVHGYGWVGMRGVDGGVGWGMLGEGECGWVLAMSFSLFRSWSAKLSRHHLQF